MRLGVVLVVAATPALLGACGSGQSTSAPTPTPFATASVKERADIERAINAFAGATTAGATCDIITRGFEAAIQAHGAPPALGPADDPLGPPDANCVSVINAAVQSKEFDLTASTVTVGKILIDHDRAAALVRGPSAQRAYFLSSRNGMWRIVNVGSPPPDFDDLNHQL